MVKIFTHVFNCPGVAALVGNTVCAERIVTICCIRITRVGRDALVVVVVPWNALTVSGLRRDLIRSKVS